MESKVKKQPLSIILKKVLGKILYWKKLMEVLLKFYFCFINIFKIFLPHKLSNDLRLMQLENMSKISELVKGIAYCPIFSEKSIFGARSQKLTNSRYQRFSGLVQFCLISLHFAKCFVGDC